MAKHRIPVPPGTTVPEPVSAVLSWRVRTGREREFEEWARQILGAVRSQPGFIATTTLRPQVPTQPYHVVLQFETAESLATWLGSTERSHWIRGSDDLGTQYRADTTGLANWFNLHGLPVQVPPRWKTVLIAFTGVYPVLLLFTWLVTPHLATQPLWLRAAWLPLLLAPTLTYVLMPALTRLFRPWLRP